LIGRGLLICALVALAVASRAGEDDRAADSIRIYYDREGCSSDRVEVEVYDRTTHAWQPHPAHPRVTVPSCQTEDAGRLWNELRWRCMPSSADGEIGWRPIRVFDPGVMSRCGDDRLAAGDRRTAIRVSSPADGAVVRTPERFVEVRGSVEVDGRAGNEYDVVLLVDRGAPDAALEAQIAAARAFVRGLAPRLGAVRIALLSYPSSEPDGGAARGAQRDVAWSTDAGELDGALTRLARRSVVSRLALPAALDAALAALASARPTAHAVIVMGIDGARLDASGPPAPGDPLLSAAERVGASGAALHWVALGGLAPEDPALVRRAVASAHGSFRRVPPQAYATPFFDAISLPVAEAVWIEARAANAPEVPASLDAQGGFRARVPIESGANALVIHARTSDGALHERRLALVFDDALAKQRKQIEIRPDPETP
jgi:hypothetical protein